MSREDGRNSRFGVHAVLDVKHPLSLDFNQNRDLSTNFSGTPTYHISPKSFNPFLSHSCRQTVLLGCPQGSQSPKKFNGVSIPQSVIRPLKH
jgi:hypothetical protein